MEKVDPKRLKGFQDYEAQSMTCRYMLMDIVRKHAKIAGFTPLATPALEYADVLLGVGGETDKQVFRFQDNGQRDVALRFDLTVPMARYVAANYGALPQPFKRFQIQDVWRAEKPQKGRFREFCQCDLDIIGVDSKEADVEILLCFMNILKDIKPGPFTMLVGNRALLSGLIRKQLGINDIDLEQKALIAIDKIDKIGVQAVAELLCQNTNTTPEKAQSLLLLLEAQKNGDLDGVKQAFKDSLEEEAFVRLQKTVATVAQLEACEGAAIKIDLSIARGLGYYTGIVFETLLDNVKNLGSICSGGRYDGLVERYIHENIPGIGGSLGLDRLCSYLLEEKIFTSKEDKTVFVAVASDDYCTYAFEVLQTLRKNNILAVSGLKTQKLGQQFKKANKLGASHVVTIGESEQQTRSVSIKDMGSGEEVKNISFDNMLKHL